ncbi:nitrilase-related carbon-nitrogen hydrolase [Nonomuraea recticatena]|uniref:Apolipoprotein N-acyltransferase n=1 Tax=Nonomuraea recticatena TaxID=46178 RepID=A0ABN3SPW4_9ACTN
MATTDVTRQPRTDSHPSPGHGRTSWLWLALGAGLLPFTTFQSVIPAAAWLAPILLLRFARTQRALVALPVLALVGYGATLVAMRGLWTPPALYLWALPGLAIVLPYAADLLAARRLRGPLHTLVFPAVETATAFLLSLDQGSAFASWGTPGYTQVTNLSLAQVVSITGVWGLSFLILWTAPVVNHLWERRPARPLAMPYCVVLLAVLVYGGTRLALFPTSPTLPASSATVPMAGLAPDRELDKAREAAAVRSGPRTEPERNRLFRLHLTPVLDDLFTRTRQAARAGAKIVAWSEAAGYVFKEEEAAFLQRATAVAREEGIYLAVGVIVILPTAGDPTNENRTILIDPSGDVRWDYAKATRVPGDGNALGPGVLPIVDTPYGRLSTVICFDADFPWLVRQAGRANVDVLLVPSSDWGPIGPVHADMAVIRAIENGVSILRPTRRGISIAIDSQGRTLAMADYFVGDDQTMTVSMPTAGTPTPYAVAGDAAGWASIAGLVILGGVALLPRRRKTR